MKVKIGETIYDANETPIMIICTHAERQQIGAMAEEATKYCQYPHTEEWRANKWAAIKTWMEEEK